MSRRRVDVIIERLEGTARGNGVFEVNGSLSRLRSPLRPGPRQTGLPFLSFLSRVSVSLCLFFFVSPSWSILFAHPGGPCPPFFSFAFTQSHAERGLSFPARADQYSINSVYGIQRSRIIVQEGQGRRRGAAKG